MLTKNAAPSDKVLGTVFGLSSVAGCLARIVSPALARSVMRYLSVLLRLLSPNYDANDPFAYQFSSLFAFSVEQHVMDGNFVWFAMTVISIVGLYVAWRVHG